MGSITYFYSDSLPESSPYSSIWRVEVELVYQDLGKRQQLHKLIKDVQRKKQITY